MTEAKSISTEDVLYFGRRLREGICQFNTARVAVTAELRDAALQIAEVPLSYMGASLHPEDPGWVKNLKGQRIAEVDAYQDACLGEPVALYRAKTEDPQFYAQRTRALRGQ